MFFYNIKSYDRRVQNKFRTQDMTQDYDTLNKIKNKKIDWKIKNTFFILNKTYVKIKLFYFTLNDILFFILLLVY